MANLSITKSDILLTTANSQLTGRRSVVLLQKQAVDPVTRAAVSSPDALIITSNVQRVRVEGFRIVSGSTGGFNEGVVIRGGASDVTLSGVTVAAATERSGIVVNGPGPNICIERTSVSGSTDGNGYVVKSNRKKGPLTGVAFVGARATANKQDGFAIQHQASQGQFNGKPPTGVVSPLFQGTIAASNGQDGYDVAGNDLVAGQFARLLNVSAINNAKRGMVLFHSAQVENAQVVKNVRIGIDISTLPGDRQTPFVRIVGSTVAQNGNVQIEAAAKVRLRVFDTIASSDQFKALEAHTADLAWDYDLFYTAGSNPDVVVTATRRCKASQINSCPGSGGHSLSKNPRFASSGTPGRLAANSPAVDAGKTPSLISVGFPVFVADSVDHDGRSRSQGGGYDIGAFELQQSGGRPTPTPVRTSTPFRTPTARGSPTIRPTPRPTLTRPPGSTPLPTRPRTRTPLPTRRATPTVTRTFRPTRTLTPTLSPTPLPCVGDCNRDGRVSAAEVRTVLVLLQSENVLNLCQAADCDSSGNVTVAELYRAIQNRRSCRFRLGDCGTLSGPPVFLRVAALPAAIQDRDMVPFAVSVLPAGNAAAAGVQFELNYDPTFFSITGANCFLADTQGRSHILDVGRPNPAGSRATVRMIVSDRNLALPVQSLAAGTLVTCDLVAHSSGSTQITGGGPVASDALGNPLSASFPPCDPAACTGDCNGNCHVTVDELIRGVAIALGNQPPANCLAFDTGGDGRVTIDELVRGVRRALDGCPNPAAVPGSGGAAALRTLTVAPTNGCAGDSVPVYISIN